MRDHRYEMTDEEREAQERIKRDITESVWKFAPRTALTPSREAKRRAKRKQQAASRKANR